MAETLYPVRFEAQSGLLYGRKFVGYIGEDGDIFISSDDSEVVIPGDDQIHFDCDGFVPKPWRWEKIG